MYPQVPLLSLPQDSQSQGLWVEECHKWNNDLICTHGSGWPSCSGYSGHVGREFIKYN